MPTPKGLAVAGAVKTATAAGPTWSASFRGTGDPGQAYQELTDAITANGFTSGTSVGGAPGGGVSSWRKGRMAVQIAVLDQDGQVAVNITAIDQAN